MSGLARKRQRLFYLALLSGALTLLGQLLLKAHRPLQLACEAVTVSFGLYVVLALLKTDREAQ